MGKDYSDTWNALTDITPNLDTLRRRVNELAQDRPELERVASECDLYGHDYDVREAIREKGKPRQPILLACLRCPWRWDIDPEGYTR